MMALIWWIDTHGHFCYLLTCIRSLECEGMGLVFCSCAMMCSGSYRVRGRRVGRDAYLSGVGEVMHACDG